MLARSHDTLCAQGGGVEDDVTVDQSGSPDRLWGVVKHIFLLKDGNGEIFWKNELD